MSSSAFTVHLMRVEQLSAAFPGLAFEGDVSAILLYVKSRLTFLRRCGPQRVMYGAGGWVELSRRRSEAGGHAWRRVSPAKPRARCLQPSSLDVANSRTCSCMHCFTDGVTHCDLCCDVRLRSALASLQNLDVVSLMALTLQTALQRLQPGTSAQLKYCDREIILCALLVISQRMDGVISSQRSYC